MDDSIGLLLLFQLVLIILNAIFASAEIAVLSISETKLEHMADDGNGRAKKLYKLAKALEVSPEYLKNDEVDDPRFGLERADYVESARVRFGSAGARDVERLLAQNAALFAGGEISEEAKDSFFQAVMKAYIDCKEKAKETYGDK